jgi:NADH dehydrogenase [ubiquinone] 1 alpha subcomplex assembly factor 5
VLDLGANACNIARILSQPPPDPDDPSMHAALKTRVGNLLCAESSPSLLYRDEQEPFNSEINITRQLLAADETLPFEANTFDAVLSSLSLHWINDLPSVLAQINHILKPDGPFLGVMLGGDTLYELRTSLQLAELDRRGGVATHTSPLADVRDIGGLLQKANFQLLTVDVDDIIIDYPDIFALMQDLQAMGESNAVVGREAQGIRRDVLAAADAIYKQLHGNEDGTIPATFRLIYMIGWKSAPTQAKPLERGTGMFSIKDILEKQGGNIKGGGDGERGGNK